MPHNSTGELTIELFNFDCRPPTKAAVLLSSGRAMAAKVNQEAKCKYKHQYDKVATAPRFKVRD